MRRAGTCARARAERSLVVVAIVVVAACVAGCGAATGERDAGDAASDAGAREDGAGASDGAATLPDGRVVRGAYATRVVSFEPGDGATFGHARMPDVVLGPPVGGGDMMGSTDVVALGRAGRICLAFDDVVITDGPGADFVVFENPFIQAGTSTLWTELGEVSVSEDGRTYRTFPCRAEASPHTGCAGWNPVYSRPDNALRPDDPRVAGGDPFDLADVGLARARYVCIRDLATRGPAPPSTGFDLDAIAAVHWAAP